MQKLINAKQQNFNVDKEDQIIYLWQNKGCPNRATANIPAQIGRGYPGPEQQTAVYSGRAYAFASRLCVILKKGALPQQAAGTGP